jgi:hypothetical protein
MVSNVEPTNLERSEDPYGCAPLELQTGDQSNPIYGEQTCPERSRRKLTNCLCVLCVLCGKTKIRENLRKSVVRILCLCGFVVDYFCSSFL